MMKKLNLGMCLLALLSICALPATAQRKDTDAAVKALTKVIKKWSNTPKTLDNAVENICSKYKKEPSVYNGAAEAFWWNGADSAHAIKYANKAIAIDSKYAPAYVLQGDIWRHYKDTVMAKKWYEKAITANPQSTVGYEAYAKMIEESDPDGAVAMLEKITAAHPEYPFHLKAARIYARKMRKDNVAGKYLPKLVGHYEQVNPDSMECSDVVEYAGWYYSLNDYNKCLAVLEPYMSKYTSDPYFNNLCLQTSVEAGQYSKAEQFANNFLSSAPDSIRKSQYYRYCVRTYMGLKKYEEAVEVSKTLMGLDIATDEDKQYAIGKIADAYSELGEFDKAEAAYAEYTEGRSRAGQLTVQDVNDFAKFYLNKAEESNGSEKIAAWMKADSLYDVMANKYIQYADMALYQRYKISTHIHTKTEEGHTLPICKQLIPLLLAKGDLDDTRKSWLSEAYYYMAYYYVANGNLKRGKEYCLKSLEANPSNKGAQNLSEVLRKY